MAKQVLTSKDANLWKTFTVASSNDDVNKQKKLENAITEQCLV